MEPERSLVHGDEVVKGDRSARDRGAAVAALAAEESKEFGFLGCLGAEWSKTSGFVVKPSDVLKKDPNGRVGYVVP